MSDSLRPHELQPARPPYPSPTRRVHPYLCPLTRWCRPAISSSVIPFSSCPQSLPTAAAAKSLQSCPTLCDLIDGSPPGSPVSGILQARILEWVATSFSNAWKWKVKEKSLSRARLRDPMDCSLPGFSLHGIFHARVLEWVAIAFSWGTLILRRDLETKELWISWWSHSACFSKFPG